MNEGGQPRFDRGRQREALGVGRRPRRGRRVGHEDGQVDGVELDGDAAGFEPRDVEHRVDDVQQPPPGLVDAVQILTRPRGRVFGEQLAVAEDGVERGAQLVAQGREKRGLGDAGRLDLLPGQTQFGAAPRLGDVADHGHHGLVAERRQPHLEHHLGAVVAARERYRRDFTKRPGARERRLDRCHLARAGHLVKPRAHEGHRGGAKRRHHAAALRGDDAVGPDLEQKVGERLEEPVQLGVNGQRFA